MKESIKFRVAIRNLHLSIDKKFITKELFKLGLKVKNVINVL